MVVDAEHGIRPDLLPQRGEPLGGHADGLARLE